MAFKYCPRCKSKSFFIHTARAIPFDDSEDWWMMPRRVEAWCNNSSCKQRFWWYRNTGKITLRNTGREDWDTKPHDC